MRLIDSISGKIKEEKKFPLSFYGGEGAVSGGGGHFWP